MKLGILSPAFPPLPCAESEFVLLLAEGLRARGNDVRVFSEPSFFTLLSQLLATEPSTLLVAYQPWLFKKYPAFERALRVFHALKPRVPLQLVYFNPSAKWRGEWATLFPSFTTIHVLSERHRLAFASRFPALTSRTVVTPVFSLAPAAPGLVSRREAKAKLGISSSYLWVSLGYLYPGKGIEVLLRAFALSLMSFPDSRLVVVGGRMAADFSGWTDFSKWLQLLAETLGIADRVSWVSDFKRDAFPTLWFQAADGAVVPGDVGVGSNNSAVATICDFGLPLVAFRGEFLDPEFEDGHNCLLAAQRSSPALAAAMGRVQSDEGLRQTLSWGSELLAKRVFSRGLALDNWNAILHRSITHSGLYCSHAETLDVPAYGPWFTGFGRTPTPQN